MRGESEERSGADVTGFTRQLQPGNSGGMRLAVAHVLFSAMALPPCPCRCVSIALATGMRKLAAEGIPAISWGIGPAHGRLAQSRPRPGAPCWPAQTPEYEYPGHTGEKHAMLVCWAAANPLPSASRRPTRLPRCSVPCAHEGRSESLTRARASRQFCRRRPVCHGLLVVQRVRHDTSASTITSVRTPAR